MSKYVGVCFMDKVAILIPCYNEALSIKKVINDCQKYIKDATIYVYDNNSTDDTAKIAFEEGAIVRHEYQQGKGNVIRRMFREIDAQCYLMIDGDDTYPLESAQKMIDEVLYKNADMVIGDRLSSTYFTENKRKFHNFGNSIVRFFVNCLFKTKIKDIMTGYRAFSYQFVKTFPVLSKGFEIETEMTIHAITKNMAISNVVIEYRDRQEGSVSKLNTYTDGVKVLKTIYRLFKNYKPMHFFFIIFLLLFLLSTGFFVPVLIDYFKTGIVPKFPTLIMCSAGYVISIFSLFTGIILSILEHKELQNFEMKLINANDSYKAKVKENERIDEKTSSSNH